MQLISKFWIFSAFTFIYFLPQIEAQNALFETRVTADFSEMKISSILDSLSGKFQINFAYNSETVPAHKVVSLKVKNLKLIFVLEKLLGIKVYNYKVIEKQIIITKANKERKVETIQILHVDQPKIIQGVIIDKLSKDPLSFASVCVFQKANGTISNSVGKFILKLPINSTDSLIDVSYLGYVPERVTVPLDTATLVIQLTRSSEIIKEVIIKHEDGLPYIKKAIESKVSNYDNYPCIMTGFYRESTKKDEKYISISEAVVSIFKSSYNSISPDQVKVFKGHSCNDDSEVSLVSYKVQGGLFYNMLLDIAKNPPTFLSADFFEYYHFTMKGLTDISGRTNFIVEFDQKDLLKYPFNKGVVFIDTMTYAISGARFGISPKGIAYSYNLLVRRSPIRLKVKPISAEYMVNYRFMNGSWILSGFKGEVKIKTKGRLINSIFTTISEMVITDKDTTEQEKFRFDEIAKATDYFEEQSAKYDESFWGPFNIIKPEESLVESINRLNICKSLLESKCHQKSGQN